MNVSLTEPIISDVERGRRNPSIEVVERIANALGVTMGQLLDLDSDLG